MPFTKIKRGKNRGKYRSPSGRVFNRKQVALYYATNGFKRLDTSIYDAAMGLKDVSMEMRDAARKALLEPSPDPTHTSRLRAQFRRAAVIRMQQFKQQVRAYVVANGMLGTGTTTNYNPAGVDPGEALKAFNSFITNTAYQVLVQQAEWASPYVEAAYVSGLEAAAILTNTSLGVTRDKFRFYVESVKLELEGIVDVTLQQLGRAAAGGVGFKRGKMATWREMNKVFNKVTVPRLNALANTMTVLIHNAGRLDYLQAAGHKKVGLLPEQRIRLPAQRVDHDCGHDHGPAKLQDISVIKALKRAGIQIARSLQNQFGFGRGSRTEGPGVFRQWQIEREEQRQSSVSQMANVETAGDLKVCKTCLDIAARGPYTINHARSLIPAHIGCRCAVVPIIVTVEE